MGHGIDGEAICAGLSVVNLQVVLSCHSQTSPLTIGDAVFRGCLSFSSVSVAAYGFQLNFKLWTGTLLGLEIWFWYHVLT